MQEAATDVYAQEVIGLKELEDPVWILMNVKPETFASMCVKILLEATSASALLVINSCLTERHAKMLTSVWSRA